MFKKLEIFAICLSMGLLWLPSLGNSQGTNFTYQGQLNNNGQAAQGNFDFRFQLWDSQTGGNLIESYNENSVLVQAGQFTVDIDFGPQPYAENQYWLEIEVDGNTLAPRQRMNAAPYASQTRGLFVDANEQIGIGTLNPQRQIEIASAQQAFLRINTVSSLTPSTLELRTLDGPGIFSPLGNINFVDEQNELRATIQGLKQAGSGLLHLNAEPGQPSQIVITNSNVNVDADLKVEGDIDVVEQLKFAGNLGTTTVRNVNDNLTIESSFPGNGGVLKIQRDATNPGEAIFAEVFDSGASGTHYAGRFVNRNDSGTLGAIDYGILAEAASVNAIAVQGNATHPSGLTFGINGVASSTCGIGVSGRATANTGPAIGVYGSSFSNEGYSFFAFGNGIDYGSDSSRRWKKNIEVIANPLEKIEKIRGVYFDWDQDHGGHHDIGMIAEEVGEVLPEIVNYEDNGVDATGMDYSKLTPLLVEAIKGIRAENKQKIAQLQSKFEQQLEQLRANRDAELDSLRARLNRLEERFETRDLRPAPEPLP